MLDSHKCTSHMTRHPDRRSAAAVHHSVVVEHRVEAEPAELVWPSLVSVMSSDHQPPTDRDAQTHISMDDMHKCKQMDGWIKKSSHSVSKSIKLVIKVKGKGTI